MVGVEYGVCGRFLVNEVGSWSRRDFLLRGRHILIEEQGGSWLLEEEAYC